MNFTEEIENQLRKLERNHLQRILQSVESTQGSQMEVNGKVVLNFSSNDYLALSNHGTIIEAGRKALHDWGAGAGSSRLLCGNLKIQEEMEEVLSEFKGFEDVLTFPTGYMAAIGTIPTLLGKGDTVVLDKRSHACLIDAARISEAKLRVFPHNDLDYLKKILAQTRTADPDSRILIVTESVFSMDGDLAPLVQIIELKERYGAWLMVDEAHGTGVYGQKRRGVIDMRQISENVEIQMGTMGKALGVAGGYIGGSAALKKLLVNRARSFIFSTAPVPVVSAMLLASLDLVKGEEGRRLQEKLWANALYLQRALYGEHSFPPPSPIFPIFCGSEKKALDTAQKMKAAGVLAPAIRFPTVPKNEARLRISITAAHNEKQIDELLVHLSQLP